MPRLRMDIPGRMSQLVCWMERGMGDGTEKCPHFPGIHQRAAAEVSLPSREDFHSPTKDASRSAPTANAGDY